MRIEKINDNQIRCTLTRQDLENHQIKLSELAYGSDKAKRLFRDMMQQAQMQVGFEADNIPLMIEAIPINLDSIVLIITKVEDPEELDTRFSKFSPYKDRAQAETFQQDGADSIIDLIQKLYEARVKNNASADGSESSGDAVSDAVQVAPVNLVRLFIFRHLDDVIHAAHGLNGFYNGANTLYKESPDSGYKLVIHQSDCTPEEFNKVCNILSEYGKSKAFTAAGEAYLKEHGEIISQNALQQLVQL